MKQTKFDIDELFAQIGSVEHAKKLSDVKLAANIRKWGSIIERTERNGSLSTKTRDQRVKLFTGVRELFIDVLLDRVCDRSHRAQCTNRIVRAIAEQPGSNVVSLMSERS